MKSSLGTLPYSRYRKASMVMDSPPPRYCRGRPLRATDFLGVRLHLHFTNIINLIAELCNIGCISNTLLGNSVFDKQIDIYISLLKRVKKT